jgi:hypothetical protein
MQAMQMRNAARTMFVFLCLLSGGPAAAGVICFGDRTVDTEFANSDVVATARIVDEKKIESRDGSTLRYTLDVAERFKGETASRIRLESENIVGEFFGDVGKTYLLFLKRQGKVYVVSLCSNSDEVGSSAAILAELRAPKPTRVEHWHIPGVSSTQWESHPAIDPLTGDVWFVRSDTDFSGWRLFVSRCKDGAWSSPEPAPIAGDGLEADPWFTPDGKTLWFISSRATGELKSSALDIWTAHRKDDGTWFPPERLPAPVNSDQAEWFPRPASDGWLYFGSRRAGGSGKDDIWRARKEAPDAWVVENVAGEDINTAGSEYEFLPDATGNAGVLATDTGLYRMEKRYDRWQRTVRMAADVNANPSVIGPMFSPSGNTLVFSRDDGDGQSGELFVAHLGEDTAWPPHCAAWR